MLQRPEVKLQVLGEHEMVVEGLQSAPKSKIVFAFHNPEQNVSCYV
jgi:hypothetical protein